MKIIGVSVDVDNLPSKEVLISMAMTTIGFRDNPLAKEEIELELKKSGLYPKAVVKPKAEENGLLTDVGTENNTTEPKK